MNSAARCNIRPRAVSIETMVFVFGCVLFLAFDQLDVALWKAVSASFGIGAASSFADGFSPTTILYMLIVGGLCVLSMCAAKKPNCLIHLIELLMLSLAFQALFWEFAGQPLHLVSSVLALAVGAFLGYAVKQFQSERKINESHYYELIVRNKELASARMQLVKQDELDRRLLAADLHDQVLNDLKAMMQVLHDGDDRIDRKLARSLEKSILSAMNSTRDVMDSLSPAAVQHLGLEGALEDCLDRGASRAGFDAFFRSNVSHDSLNRLNAVEQSLFYRLAQESVTNICKHACASKVELVMLEENSLLTVRIIDDGRGVDKQKFSDDSRGLRYMRQRADLLGATVSWSPGVNGQGTAVEIKLDLKGGNLNASSNCR